MEKKPNWNEQSSGLLRREYVVPNPVGTIAQREAFIKKLTTDIKQFLADGGIITILPAGASSYENIFDPNRQRKPTRYGHEAGK